MSGEYDLVVDGEIDVSTLPAGCCVTLETFTGQLTVMEPRSLEDLTSRWIESLPGREDLPSSLDSPLQVQLQDGRSLPLYAAFTLLGFEQNPLPLEAALYLLFGASPSVSVPFVRDYLQEYGVTSSDSRYTAVSHGRFGFLHDASSHRTALLHLHSSFATVCGIPAPIQGDLRLYKGSKNIKDGNSAGLFSHNYVHPHNLSPRLDSLVVGLTNCPKVKRGECAFPSPVNSNHFLYLAEHYLIYLQQRSDKDSSFVLPAHLSRSVSAVDCESCERPGFVSRAVDYVLTRLRFAE